MTAASPTFTVAVCRRNRPQQLARTLQALGDQDEAGFPLLVVDQSDQPDEELAAAHRGPYVGSWEIGFGVCMAIRRDWIHRIGGWNERLGPGGTVFPPETDIDFNFRLLRAGGTAVNVPEVRVIHEQWRTREEFIAIERGYARSYAGFAVKTVRQGSPRAGLRLWLRAAFGNLTRHASAARRRSLLRLRLAIGETRGHWGRHADGTGRALVSS